MNEHSPEIVYEIDVSEIDVSHLNVRQHDRTADLASLAESIKKDGQLQPVVLVGNHEDKGRRKLIVGQRRFLAIRDILNKDGKWPTIRAVFLERQIDDDEARRLSLAENLQRVSLNVADKMEAITAVFRANGCHVGRTAAQLGVSGQTIRNWVELDQVVTPHMKRLMKAKRLRPTDARRVILAAMGSVHKADALADRLAGHNLSVYEKTRMTEYGSHNPKASAPEIIRESGKAGKARHVLLYLPDLVFDALERAAKAKEMASDDIAAEAVEDWLRANGYLSS